MATPESLLLSSLCDYLAMRRHYFWRSNNVPVYMPDQQRFRAMPKYSMKGVPDIILIKDGRFVGIEAKPKGKYQSKEQKDFEEKSCAAGAEYILARSIDDLVAAGL